MPCSKILLVDDDEPFRKFVRSALEPRAEFQIIGEASDGLEAIQQVGELGPDLVLLDAHLPKLSGIEAAKQVSQLSPRAKLLFVSHESSSQVIHTALRSGALGYVYKVRAASELLPAIDSVLRNVPFVSNRLEGDDPPPEVSFAHQGFRHEVQFYSDDAVFLLGFSRFIASALKGGKAVVVIATAKHRAALDRKLASLNIDISAAQTSGRFISLDAAKTLSQVLVDGVPDADRFDAVVGGVIGKATAVAKGAKPCVTAFGEMVGLLWELGDFEGAIRLELLWNQLALKYCFSLRCAYPMSDKPSHSRLIMKVCEEHSAVFFR